MQFAGRNDIADAARLSTFRAAGGGNLSISPPKPYVNMARGQLMVYLSSKLAKILATRNQKFDQVTSYTDLLNSWVNSVYVHRNVSHQESGGWEEGCGSWTVFRRIQFLSSDGVVELKANTEDPSLAVATNQAAEKILRQLRITRTQADDTPSKESIQGDATQSSSKESNTIVTRDQQQTESHGSRQISGRVSQVASSEPTQQFNSLVGRWMPLKKINITTTQTRGENIAQYYLPEHFLTSEAKCAPNTIPFETFVYGQYDVKMKFVVNANKFQCGKVIVSALFDSYQADALYDNWQAHLSRKHIVLDLSANNEGVIDIPFRYHRAFVRNQTHQSSTVGVRAGKYATVFVTILSQLATGKDGANDMDIRPFYMLSRADFAGMSYKVALTQMDTVGSLVNALPTPALKAILQGVEKTLDQLGKGHNQDKPTDNRHMVVIPKPRQHFPNGKGFSDPSVLRMNPYALTSFGDIHNYSDDPKTMLDIAKIWGLRSTFNWKADSVEGSELFNSIIDPSMRLYTSDYDGQPTPLEYACGMYQFWSGPIEIRLDFISNAFHTGAVIISAEYNRSSDATDECQSHSTYTKTFHLGDQKSVTFRIPYIYDTIMRRSCALPYCPVLDGTTTNDVIKREAIGVRPESRMRLKVRVINKLRPVATAPQTIEVLMFMRAGENFVLHGLCQMSYTPSEGIANMDSFPNDNYVVTAPKPVREKRSLPEELTPEQINAGQEKTYAERILPPTVRNKWNEYREIQYRVQMDNGEKENEDTTDDFSHGTSSFGMQSLDSQVGIKDILRRPVLLFDQVTIKGAQTGFFIPLMPPSRMLMANKAGGNTFAGGLGWTPQAAVMNLFRFWRGSLRYTIIIHGTPNHPIYITHVPHSGTRLFANKKINDADSTIAPIYGSGLTTEMIIASVNRTACIEVPFDTENNWALTFDEDSLRNYSWRDKADTNSGHLVITSKSDCNMTVWWSAGDDFEVANFYGIPKMKTNHWAYEHNDQHAVVQMDFKLSNISTAVGMLKSGAKAITSSMSPERVATTALCAVPVIGPAYTTATLLNNVGSVVNKVSEATENMQTSVNSKLEQVSDRLGESMDTIVDLIKTTIDKFTSGLSIVANFSSYCFDVVLDIIIAAIDKSWTAIGFGIVRFLSKIIGNVTLSHLTQYAYKLGTLLGEIMRPQSIQVQAPPMREGTLVGILAGLVGTVLGTVINPNRYYGIGRSLVERITSASGASYLLSVLRFVEGTFTTLRDMVMNTLGYVSPEAAALKMLSGSSSELNSFILDAQVVTSEANASMTQNANYRQKLWSTVMQAYQIQKLLITVPTAHVSPCLSRLCSDVIKVGNDKFIDVSASPVRYEPFVITIEGPAGIGKSELVESLVASMLDELELRRPHSGAIFFRNPGSQFWSGYRDQPCVVYDDWMNMTSSEQVTQQLSEIYMLKSTSLFIPPMAHLEEKKIRGNPLIVILLTNNAFPESAMSSAVLSPEAVLRRRDVLLRATRKDDYATTKLRDMTTEEQTTFAHLQFAQYPDVTKREVGKKWIGYEATKQYLIGSFKRWHVQEEIKVKRRLELAQAGMHGVDVASIRLEDPFSLYYNISTQVANNPDNNQNAFLPSEVLAAEVARITNAVEAHQADLAVAPIPAEPSNPFVVTQVDFRHLRSLTIGCLTTRYSLESILRLTADQCRSLYTKLCRSRLSADCAICMEVKTVHLVCRLSQSSDSAHYICGDCVTQATRVGAPVTTCPMCRSTSLEIYTEARQLLGVTMLGKIAAKLLLSTQQICDMFISWFGPDWGYITSVLTRVSLLVVATTHGVISMDTARSSFAVGSLVDRAENLTRTIGSALGYTQMDSGAATTSANGPQREGIVYNPFTETTEVEEATPQDVLAVRVNTRNLRMVLAATTTDPELPCLHASIGEAHHVTYKDGYYWPIAAVGVKVNELPCATDTCPWRDQNVYLHFLMQYLRHHKARILSHIHGYVNTEDSRAYHMARIPLPFRPDWMTPLDEFAAEVGTLTQETWWEKLGDFFTRYKTLIITLGGVSGAIGSIILIKKLFTGDSLPMIQTGMVSGDQYTRNLARTHRTLNRVRARTTHFQATSDGPPEVEAVKKHVARNYVQIRIQVGDDERILIACGLFGRKALLPRHYHKAVRTHYDAGRKIFLSSAVYPQEKIEYNYDPKDFLESTSTDLAIFTVPASYGMFKDIRKFLCTDEDLARPISTEGDILLAPTVRNPMLREQAVEVKGIQNSAIVDDADGERFEALDVLCYGYSQPGACGSLVFTKRSQRPIIAMHFAGVGTLTQGEGYGVLLTKELMGEMMNESIVVEMEDPPLDPLEEAKIWFPESCNVTYKGALPKELVTFMPKKTKIRPSLIQNINGLEPVTEPCILDKTDPRYIHDQTPLYHGCVKHGVGTTDFKTSQLDRAETALWDGWIGKLKPKITNPSKLTAEQACVGFPGVDFYDPMDLKTSAGYPHSAGPLKKKSDFITFERDASEQPIGAEIALVVADEMKRKSELRKKGIVPYTPFIDTLKDERRKPEKARKAGGTRVFCNPPVDFVISTRQLLLHFSASYMADRMNQQHAVGINVNGTEWSQLAYKLINTSPNNIVTIDYANFGPGFNSGVAERAINLMVRWTMENVADVNELELRTLLHECLYSTHICHNTVYQQKCGSPSGAPITVIINTLVNELLVLLAWDNLQHQYCKENNLFLWETYKNNVTLFCYGDDLIMSVSDRFIKTFNALEISKYFKKHNIVATDANKGAEVVPYEPITKATFLKHAFKRHERHHHLWQSALDWDSINDTTQWIWEAANYKQATFENCKAAIMQAHGHGLDKFTKFKDQVNRALIKAGCETVTLTWEEVDDLFYPTVVY